MEDYNQPPMALGPARDPEELRLLMFANNQRRGKRFHYFDFTFIPKKGWFGWFELKLKDELANVNK
jgi:hypothetical protein